MENNLVYKTNLVKVKSRIYLFICTLALATLALPACNNNNNKGDATVQNDTSSAVTDRVDIDTSSTGTTKQP